MQYNLVNIINTKLYNFKYINFLIIFCIIVFYSYYNLYNYLINKNYIMIILYFTLLILLYKNYNKFSYFICYLFLLIFKLFNIDYFLSIKTNSLFNNIIESQSNIADANETVTLGGSNTTGDEARNRAETQGNELKKTANNSESKNNPCESYITNRLQQLGINISSNSYSMADQTESTEKKIDEMMPSEPIDTSIANNSQRLI